MQHHGEEELTDLFIRPIPVPGELALDFGLAEQPPRARVALDLFLGPKQGGRDLVQAAGRRLIDNHLAIRHPAEFGNKLGPL
jgi:hypothetical protein